MKKGKEVLAIMKSRKIPGTHQAEQIHISSPPDHPARKNIRIEVLAREEYPGLRTSERGPLNIYRAASNRKSTPTMVAKIQKG